MYSIAEKVRGEKPTRLFSRRKETIMGWMRVQTPVPVKEPNDTEDDSASETDADDYELLRRQKYAAIFLEGGLYGTSFGDL
jgi:hypothetical protein